MDKNNQNRVEHEGRLVFDWRLALPTCRHNLGANYIKVAKMPGQETRNSVSKV